MKMGLRPNYMAVIKTPPLPAAFLLSELQTTKHRVEQAFKACVKVGRQAALAAEVDCLRG